MEGEAALGAALLEVAEVAGGRALEVALLEAAALAEAVAMAWATLEAAVPAAVQQGAEAEAWLAVEDAEVAVIAGAEKLEADMTAEGVGEEDASEAASVGRLAAATAVATLARERTRGRAERAGGRGEE